MYLREFAPLFQQLGVTAVQGGAGSALTSQQAGRRTGRPRCSPGRAVAGVLVSGDMSVTGLGTVTYNDGKRMLAFGHPFFNIGPVDMPMSKGEMLMMLSSPVPAEQDGNATEIVGALQQDRHSGIMGVLGDAGADDPGLREGPLAGRRTTRSGQEKTYHFNVFRATEVDAAPDDDDAVQLHRRA